MKLTTQDNLPALGTFVESSPMSDEISIEIVLKCSLHLPLTNFSILPGKCVSW